MKMQGFPSKIGQQPDTLKSWRDLICITPDEIRG